MSVKEEPKSAFHFQLSYKGNQEIKVGIAVAEWNPEITDLLLQSCYKTLLDHGIAENNIIIQRVPGSYELPLAAQWLFKYKKVDAVCCLGCVIKGETPHFHYISDYVAQAIGKVSLDFNRPVSFGVITAEKEEHAVERAGGIKGNKGEEAALAVLKMLMARDALHR